MFRLLKKRFRDDFVVYKRLHGEKISDSRRFLNLAEKKISHGWKLKLDTFKQEVRCTFLRVRAIKYWGNLPRDMVDIPSREVFTLSLDVFLEDILYFNHKLWAKW